MDSVDGTGVVPLQQQLADLAGAPQRGVLGGVEKALFDGDAPLGEPAAAVLAHHIQLRALVIRQELLGLTDGVLVVGTGKSLILYISVLFILPYIFASDNSFARFHAKQGLGLFIFGAVADVIGSISPLAWLLWLIRIYCIYKGVTGALSGQTEPLPLLGKYIK